MVGVNQPKWEGEMCWAEGMGHAKARRSEVAWESSRNGSQSVVGGVEWGVRWGLLYRMGLKSDFLSPALCSPPSSSCSALLPS